MIEIQGPAGDHAPEHAWHGSAGTVGSLGSPREVLLASPRSFCAGVERAIEIVESALAQRGRPVYVRKQIVHNTHVVADLAQRGAVFVDELDQVPDDATVIFSAHGVSPAVHAEAAGRGLEVIDATCPLVTKVHAEARRFAARGDTVVLIGHADHEEMEGTSGEAPAQTVLVTTADDVATLTVADPARVSYLTQTTLAVDETAEVIGTPGRTRPPPRHTGLSDRRRRHRSWLDRRRRRDRRDRGRLRTPGAGRRCRSEPADARADHRVAARGHRRVHPLHSAQLREATVTPATGQTAQARLTTPNGDKHAAGLLEQVGDPAALRGLAPDRLAVLAEQIRSFLIAKVAAAGGHLGPNLGAVELTIALHWVFHSPRDAGRQPAGSAGRCGCAGNLFESLGFPSQDPPDKYLISKPQSAGITST
jgi:hypothetical protein